MRETEPILEEILPPLQRIGGTTRAKEDLIAILSAIMESFVDRAFGVDAVQHAIASQQINTPPAVTVPHRRNRQERSGQQRRSRTMHIPATKVSNKRRTRPCRTRAS
ncbi:hypothetical protein ELI33_08500 [Rhizobium ruizarguesonis]|nr:hypothetical protein ELI33_08500 [Rhizobium ruizarguesonis]